MSTSGNAPAGYTASTPSGVFETRQRQPCYGCVMRLYVGITDWEWFEMLSVMRPDEVHFGEAEWRQGLVKVV